MIEVNTPPTESWGELVDITTTLYEEARQTRLGTEKFAYDGRHTGTGGGNHVVLGGRTPIDSPFLRRPDLLRSLVALLEQSPIAVVFILWHVHRADEPGAARRRGAAQLDLRVGNGLRPVPDPMLVWP